MDKAYMIRNDGKAFPVLQHPYGNVDEITETLYAGEWLYNHTQHSDVKRAFIELIALYAKFVESLNNPETLISDLCTVIGSAPYKYLSADFVQLHGDEIVKAYESMDDSAGKSLLNALSKIIVDELNQEFLRARWGGLYNSKASSKEMVFRVSSTGFNWYSIIWKFVFENQAVIDSVTIVRDEEATGMHNEFYHARNGEAYSQMPVDQFIEESGNPVIETKCPVRTHLMNGGSIIGMKSLPMNEERIMYRYRCLVNQENRERSFWFLSVGD